VWGFRDEGISSVVNSLPNLGVDKVHVFRSIVSVIKRGLSDKIPQVYVYHFHSTSQPSPILLILRLFQVLFLAAPAASVLRRGCKDGAGGRRHGSCRAFGCCSCRQASGQINVCLVLFAQLHEAKLIEPVSGRQHAHQQRHERCASCAGCEQERWMRHRCLGSFLPCCFCFSRLNCSCAPAAQAPQVAKRVAARSLPPADHHPAAARQRHDTRKWLLRRFRNDFLCRIVRFGQWAGYSLLHCII
jgi:hypothetical protein